MIDTFKVSLETDNGIQVNNIEHVINLKQSTFDSDKPDNHNVSCELLQITCLNRCQLLESEYHFFW